MFSDSLVGFGINRFVNLVSKHTIVWYYKNSFQSFQGRESFLQIDDKPAGKVIS